MLRATGLSQSSFVARVAACVECSVRSVLTAFSFSGCRLSFAPWRFCYDPACHIPAKQAAGWLENAGYSGVVNMEGGFGAWARDDSLPVEM